MKSTRLCAVAFAVAAAFLAAPVTASPLNVGDSVNVSDQGGGAFGPGGWSQNVDWSINGGATFNTTQAGLFVLDYKHVAPVPTSYWTQFLSFCLEPQYSLTSFDNPYSVQSVPGANGAKYAPVAGQLAELWGRYFDSVNSGLTAAAFQLAIWELGFDNSTNLSAGNFRSQSADPGKQAAATLAQAWLSSLDGTGPKNYRLVVLQDAAGDPNRQDLITVPEPGTLALLGLGLLGIGALRRRAVAVAA